MSSVFGDIERVLSEINSIRSHLAAGTLFRGFGPLVMALTGAMAVLTALAQAWWPATLAADPVTYLLCWIAVAVIAALLIGAEMLARSRRLHGGLADVMVMTAIEQFLPAGVAGAAITAVMLKYAPDSLWILPGLWQVLVALGIFTSLRSLPRAIGLVAAWYFLAGIAVLILASGSQVLTPWMMGLPFGVGQLLMALILRAANGESDAHT